MSKDYLEYQFEQAVGEQLKSILTAKDLANMVITVKIEFKNKAETEEEKEERHKQERKWTRNGLKSKFIEKWEQGRRKRKKYYIENVPRDQRDDHSGPAYQKWADEIRKAREDLYEEFFPGEKEEEFLER